MTLIVGAIGKPCAGKGTIYTFIEEFFSRKDTPNIHINHVRFSDTLREIAVKRNLSNDRATLQRLAQQMENDDKRRGFGPGALSRATGKRIEALVLNADLIYVDGVRWSTDNEIIRSFPSNLLVHVIRPIKDRWKASKKRGENAGETTKTFAEFQREDVAHNEQFIDEIGRTADFTIHNNRPLEEGRLKEQVEVFCRKYVVSSFFV